ncbi:MAG TPA: trypsin-like peptidase domain-containing protein [Labilithrix sp.]|jgi:serine protease Do
MKQRAVVLVFVVTSIAACKSKPPPASEALPPGAVPVASATADIRSESPVSVSSAPLELKTAPLSFAPIAKKADPSVVTIYNVVDSRRGKMARGLGTGFVVQKDGVIVTNNHVVDGADSIVVQLSDERRFPAKIAGRDPRTDIAVVRIDGAKDLVPVALGDSERLDVGDWVVAIGNPFGLSHTVSAGIVSGKGRGVQDVPLDPAGYYNFVQTDASINPGNSGGPLLNLRGEVVGMNTAIRGGGAQGIGFAIPINMVKQLLPTLLTEGHITRSALGVRIADVREISDDDKKKHGIGDEKGAVIMAVEPNGPADKAKLQADDVIVAFDGQQVDKSSKLQWLASTAGVGKNVTVRVVRTGKPFDLKVTLGELKEPATKKAPRFAPPPQQDDDDDDNGPFGR